LALTIAGMLMCSNMWWFSGCLCSCTWVTWISIHVGW